jgi:hypothetical protein
MRAISASGQYYIPRVFQLGVPWSLGAVSRKRNYNTARLLIDLDAIRSGTFRNLDRSGKSRPAMTMTRDGRRGRRGVLTNRNSDGRQMVDAIVIDRHSSFLFCAIENSWSSQRPVFDLELLSHEPSLVGFPRSPRCS